MGGIVGPAAFIGAWVAGTVVLDGYSPITDAISRLAAVGADTRWLMSTGFLAFAAASVPAAAAAALKCTRVGGRLGAPNRAEVEAFLGRLKASPWDRR